jgi:hypothetical protein
MPLFTMHSLCATAYLSLIFAVATPAIGAVSPQEIYTGGLNSSTAPPVLRIATGGAGQSGLVKGRRPLDQTKGLVDV